jgi:hypothetical protein
VVVVDGCAVAASPAEGEQLVPLGFGDGVALVAGSAEVAGGKDVGAVDVDVLEERGEDIQIGAGGKESR